jgi:hypothetical protein
MQAKKERKKVQVAPLLTCPPSSISKTSSIECLEVILSKFLRNPLLDSFSFSPHSIFCSIDSVFAFCQAVHDDSRNGRYHSHIHHLEFKRMDLDDAALRIVAIAINCLSLRSVNFYGCRISEKGTTILGNLWHRNEFLHLKQFFFEECDSLPSEEPTKVNQRSSCNLDSIFSIISSQNSNGDNVHPFVPEIERLSFRNTLLCPTSKMQLIMFLPDLKKLASLDLSGTGEWVGKNAFLLGQCINSLPNITSWHLNRVDLCQSITSIPAAQQAPVTDSHMLLLGFRMKAKSEFNSLYFQQDWTYTYQENEIFRSPATHLSFSHACSAPGMGSLALTSILNCFPNLQSFDLSSSLISHSSAHLVFNQIHIHCPKLRKADFSRCSG